MGISDMEGVERFWSRMRKLIGMTRTQWSSRRIWILDGHTEFINSEGLEGLGHWLDRQQEKNLLPKLKKAVKVLQDCRISDHELRTQWREQKAARMAPRIEVSRHFQKELDKVIALQNQIQTLETTIEDTKKTILSGGPSAELLVHLDRLEDSHASLSDQADALYSSLNIRKDLRNLAGVPAEFVKTLLIMHDLKINIRKRAVGSFYETEMLDRAVAGRSEALGTKLYQATRKALSKRQPVLYRLINRFNSLCEQLEDEMPPHSLLPLPTQLSTKLSVLKADQSLFEDICVLPTGNKIPRWLDDSDVRDGIQNSCHSIRLSVADPTLIYLLNVHMDRITFLTERWRPSFRMYEMHTSSGGQITPSKCVDASASAFFSQQHPANASAGLPNVDADASADNYVHANASAQSQDMIQVALSAPSANLHLPTSLDEVEDEVFDGFTDTEEINIALQALNITECDDTTIPDEGSVQIDIRWDVPLVRRSSPFIHENFLLTRAL
ncbi:unnamed protein product [Mycena citricolor]|uniref:Uncharacterized protein n=1 Tax=Mycena citricolor TaxID=2018698 RepID=A0AAD2H9M6_9AGAR|nr:unnamed protein product [Mycena citricolor]